MTRPIILLLPPLLLAGCGSLSDGKLGEGCKVAEAYARQFLKEATGPIAVAHGPKGLMLPGRADLEAIVREHPEFVGRQDLRLAYAQGDVRRLSPVTSCPNLRAFLDGAGILHDDARIDRLANPGTMDRYPFGVLTMSMPVIDRDGRTAAMTISDQYGALAGGTALVTLEKSRDGAWIVKRTDTLSIS